MWIKQTPFSRRALVLTGLAAPLVAACGSASADNSLVPADANDPDVYDAFDGTKWRRLSDDEWRERLSPEAFKVLRREGTERAFSSPLNDEKRAGIFHCAGCDLPLFASEAKYDSGTGWPSFWKPLPGALGSRPDNKLWMERTEYHCARCIGHQGHVFRDGPRPTGLRYCNNGVALRFEPA